MILEVHVENLAVLEDAALLLGPGFTAVTGETGAGKSLLVDAIGLALGDRADTDLVRSGCERAIVHLVVDVSDNSEAMRLCAEAGAPFESGRLIVQREVYAEGRSQVRIGGKPFPLSTLRSICACVADLHGQHEHQSLLDADGHLDHLDAWIGEAAMAGRSEVERLHAQVERLRAELARLRTGQREREQRTDLLRYQVAEIEAARPQPGEMGDLEARLSRLQNVGRLAAAVAEAKAALDDLGLEGVRSALASLDRVASLDPELDGPIGPLRAALYSAEEASAGLGSYGDMIEADPAALQDAADRIDLLRRLRRKYGEDERAVLAHLEDARRELATLENSESTEAWVATDLESAERTYFAAASALSRLRASGAAGFSVEVAGHLADLAMESARFEARVSPCSPSGRGIDRVEFLFSANPGEHLRPLDRIASGGEISRAMLAIKVASAGRAGVPTLIFDEVDVGLGGRAAAAVAGKLQALAELYQVLVISHLPQIAGRATTHFRIEKRVRDGRTATEVRKLGEVERIEEIARMLGGEAIGEAARANARELLF